MSMALSMWSQMWSAPMRRSMPALWSTVETSGRTPESTTWIPSACDELMSISRLWMPVESMKGTLRMRRMRTAGLADMELRMSSSNFVATPKKNGPSIS